MERELWAVVTSQTARIRTARMKIVLRSYAAKLKSCTCAHTHMHMHACTHIACM